MSRWAFLGSGEFEPWHDEVDGALLGGVAGTVLVAPTASAHEGEATFDGWATKGVAHYERRGVPARVLPLRTREDASSDEVLSALEDAALIFFSGGNPWRLAEAVRGTPFWDRLTQRLQGGLAYAGCSAGVACLTERTFDSDTEDIAEIFKPGIGWFRDLLFAPHWDMVDTWIPGATGFIAGSMGPGESLIGIDETTAMVGDGATWDVMGTSGVHVLCEGTWEEHRAGDRFELPLLVA